MRVLFTDPLRHALTRSVSGVTEFAQGNSRTFGLGSPKIEKLNFIIYFKLI